MTIEINFQGIELTEEVLEEYFGSEYDKLLAEFGLEGLKKYVMNNQWRSTVTISSDPKRQGIITTNLVDEMFRAANSGMSNSEIGDWIVNVRQEEIDKLKENTPIEEAVFTVEEAVVKRMKKMNDDREA